MENSSTEAQPPKTQEQDKKKADWAELTGSEDDDEETTQQKEQKAAKKEEKLAYKLATAKTGAKPKATGTTTERVPSKTESKIQRNVFECEDLDVDDSDDEVTNNKPEKVSLKDLVPVKTDASKDVKKANISKKEQKKKELEDMDKVLAEMGLQPKPAEEAKPVDAKPAEAKSSEEKKEEAHAEGEDKKKPKKEKKEDN